MFLKIGRILREIPIEFRRHIATVNGFYLEVYFNFNFICGLIIEIIYESTEFSE